MRREPAAGSLVRVLRPQALPPIVSAACALPCLPGSRWLRRGPRPDLRSRVRGSIDRAPQAPPRSPPWGHPGGQGAEWAVPGPCPGTCRDIGSSAEQGSQSAGKICLSLPASPKPVLEGTGMAPTLCPSRPQLGSRRLRRVQRLLRGRPAGEGGALRGGPGDPPEAAAPCPVQSAGPRAGSGGSLQPPGLPGEVSAGRQGGDCPTPVRAQGLSYTQPYSCRVSPHT